MRHTLWTGNILLLASLLFVVGCGGGNNGDNNIIVPPIDVEIAPPTGFKAEAISATKIKLSWQPNDSVFNAYYISRSKRPDTGFEARLSAYKPADSCIDADVTTQVTYYYKIQGINTASGKASKLSDAVQATTAAVPWTGTIAIRWWSFLNQGETGQLIYITPTSSATVSSNVGKYGSIYWSPNGNWLIAKSLEDSVFKSTLAFYDKNGVPIAKSATVFYRDENLYSWLPDSSGVLCGDYFDGIYLCKTDGTDQKLLTSSSATYDHSPTLSRDGNWVYFLHHEYGTSCSVYRIDKNQLLNGGKNLSNCQKIIGFTTTHDEEAQLETTQDGRIIVAHGKIVELVNPANGQVDQSLATDITNCKASPDGRYLAILTGPAFTVLDTSTLAVTSKVSLADIGLTGYFKSLCWSPNSDALAIISFSGDAGIWWMDKKTYQYIYRQSDQPKTQVRTINDYDDSIAWTR